MPTQHRHDPNHLYFLTGAVVKWLNLFNNKEYAKIILNTLDWNRKQRRILLFAYVIMPTHIHLIIKPLSQCISETVQSFASYTSHEVLKKLKKHKDIRILEIMEQENRDQRSKYSVWQKFHSENIFSEQVLNQKLNYIHLNPVRNNEDLLFRSDDEYSSAKFYDLGKQGFIEIDDIRDYLSDIEKYDR